MRSQEDYGVEDLVEVPALELGSTVEEVLEPKQPGPGNQYRSVSHPSTQACQAVLMTRIGATFRPMPSLRLSTTSLDRNCCAPTTRFALIVAEAIESASAECGYKDTGKEREQLDISVISQDPTDWNLSSTTTVDYSVTKTLFYFWSLGWYIQRNMGHCIVFFGPLLNREVSVRLIVLYYLLFGCNATQFCQRTGERV
jgi:hypothetical protein